MNCSALRIAPYRVQLETTGEFRVPEYKGALFRGGFGQFFRDLVCATRRPVCTGCPHLHTCAYSTVFETPVDPERFRVLRKYTHAPHPFVLTPPLDTRTALPAGSRMEVGLTLIGRGIEYLAHFIPVFEAMGRSAFDAGGCGGGSISLDGYHGVHTRLRSSRLLKID